MSLENFWFNFQMSTGLLQVRPAVDSPRLDSQRIEEFLSGSDFWLTHVSVKGYEVEDFQFLGEIERNELQSGVEQFRDVATKARIGGILNDDELKQARSGFRRILEVMRPDKYNDIDAFVIGKKIENHVRELLPDWVRELVFETDLDSSGSPAIWIWVEVEDDVVKSKLFFDKFRIVDETLTQAAIQICPERWPYIRLRGSSEQRPKQERRPKARSSRK
jgi:hypothetical protein